MSNPEDFLSAAFKKLLINKNMEPAAQAPRPVPRPQVKDITSNHLSVIPQFEGDPNTLSLYITNCEYVINTFANRQQAEDPINEFLLRVVQSKLAGRALQLLGCHEAITSWVELKELLQLNFCDQRTEKCLVQDLMNLRPDRNESAYNFGMRCKSIRNLLLTKIKMTVNNAATRAVKAEIHNDTTLQTYLRGIVSMGEIGHRVRFRNPANIDEAMSFILEEENFNYFVKQPNSVNKSEFKPMRQQIPTRAYTPIYQKPLNQFAATQWPQQQVQPKVFAGPSQQPQNKWLQPQNNWQPAQQKWQKPNSFRFQKTPAQLENPRQPRQTPMEIGSSRTLRPGNYRSFPNTNTKNWVAEELYHQEEEEEQVIPENSETENYMQTPQNDYAFEEYQEAEAEGYAEEANFYQATYRENQT